VRILGLDTAVANLGVAVLETDPFGWVHTFLASADTDLAYNQQLIGLTEYVEDVCQVLDISVIGIEAIPRIQSQRQRAMTHLEGLFIGLAGKLGIDAVLVNPMSAKKWAVGKGNATKQEVSDYMISEYDFPDVDDFNLTDAGAVAVYVWKSVVLRG